MTGEGSKVTVFYDGSCPLCSWEIKHYAAQDKAGSLALVDISHDPSGLPAGLDQQTAMRRLHVMTPSGIKSGAAAFASVWAALPGWHLASRVASRRPVLWVLELAYRAFLPVRPLISRIFRRFQPAR